MPKVIPQKRCIICKSDVFGFVQVNFAKNGFKEVIKMKDFNFKLKNI